MTSVPAWQLIHRARLEGAVLSLGSEGKVLLDLPNTFPVDLLDDLRSHRDDVAAALRDQAEEEAALRDWLPKFGSPVRDRATGRTGTLWGATKHGLIVDFGPGAPLLTLDPRSVIPG